MMVDTVIWVQKLGRAITKDRQCLLTCASLMANLALRALSAQNTKCTKTSSRSSGGRFWMALELGWTLMDISVCAAKADGGASHQSMRLIGNKFGDVPCSLTLSTSLLPSLLIPLPSAFSLPRSLSDVASCASRLPYFLWATRTQRIITLVRRSQ